MKRIYLPDIHLSPVVKSSDWTDQKIGRLTDLLDGKVLPYDELILVGDTWEPEYYGYWTDLAKSFPPDLLRRLIEIPKVILAGNHDPYERLIEVIPDKVRRSYLTDDGVLCVHGDVFDGTIARLPKFSTAVDQFGLILERYCWKGSEVAFNNFSAWISGKGKFGTNADYVEHLEPLAAWHRAPVVIWGHTHFAELSVKEKCLLANGGTWKGTDPATFVYQKDEMFEIWQVQGSMFGVTSRGRRA